MSLYSNCIRLLCCAVIMSADDNGRQTDDRQTMYVLFIVFDTQVLTVRPQQQVSTNHIISVRYVAIIATAAMLVTITTIDSEPHGVANGLFTSILLVYTIYTLLTTRLLVVAAITSITLTVLHLGLSAGLNTDDPSIRTQASIHYHLSM